MISRLSELIGLMSFKMAEYIILLFPFTEVYLSEKLTQMHPWADMVKLARTGGEANAIAIRIARAFSKKQNIAVCGYHGWHDWYLATNLSRKDNLSEHLIPGLEPNGVPDSLEGTIFPFSYNNYEEDLVEKENIGIIKMEVERNAEPKDNFLSKVRSLATKNNIILIFDECTSGFRETFGGLHKKYKINPDIAVFGKALGNGYPITAVIGKKEIMNAAQNSFISSTFWTDRIGPTAALKTLEIMEKDETWKQISKFGKEIKERWIYLGKKYNLPLKTFGLSSLCGFIIDSEFSNEYITYITQEMLKYSFLASDTIYVSTAHNEDILNNYFDILDEIFAQIEKCEENKDISKYLNSNIRHKKFERLN